MADDAQRPPTPPEAAADKPASGAPAEPLKGEVSRTDAPGAVPLSRRALAQEVGSTPGLLPDQAVAAAWTGVKIDTCAASGSITPKTFWRVRR